MAGRETGEVFYRGHGGRLVERCTFGAAIKG
jgi:hypothetical protein